MRYISTRGEAPELGFADVLLAGLAGDGGLYVPKSWPTLAAAEIASFAGKPFASVAHAIIARFTGGEIEDAVLKEACRAAYATFRHDATCPLVQVATNDFILELFHGPTLAFKDVAMQLLARLMDHVLTKSDGHATIVGATSGDTGGAAIEAFRGRARADVFILFPDGRVSDVQRRQMTTAAESNVHAIAVDGTFDDCQALVKAMFAHKDFRERVHLSGVNSINWARIVAQIVYFVTAAASLGAPHRRVSFSVPTGNFGDIFAGYAAMRMGLPVERLIVATNVNDILARALHTGVYDVRGVVATTSPSMDIQVSSNFERLLFEASERDSSWLRAAMASLNQSRRFAIPDQALRSIRTAFDAGRADEAEVADTIRSTLDASGYLLDPHTAVGYAVAKLAGNRGAPMVTLGTAHPAKFPAAVKAACGIDPALPVWLHDLHERPERFDRLPADQGVIERYILERARIGAGASN